VSDSGCGVLLIGESDRSFSHITRRLERHGCYCRFADSYEQARELLAQETFSLVLSVIPPRKNAISLLTEMLLGTEASIYYVQPVEDSCWWLPALRQGERCFGTPALRPSEFAAVLDREVERILGGVAVEPKPAVAPVISMLKPPAGRLSEAIEDATSEPRVRSKVAR
jgi:hypothetical protein